MQGTAHHGAASADLGRGKHSGAELSDSRFTMIIGVTAVLFFLGLLPLEAIPEIPVDIDSKPFFIPLVLIALLPSGRPGVAIGLGVALGEGIRDMMEGYELDDPIGFVGYFLAFALTSLMFGKQPPGKVVILVAGVTCAFIQAAIEASSFLLFGEESLWIVVQSTLGNTFTHGIIWGAIPAFFLVPILQGRFERYLGFPVKGKSINRPPLDIAESDFEPHPDALSSVKGVYFFYPSSAKPVLENVSLDLRAGEALGLVGLSDSGKSALCRILADVAPRATGGDLIGSVTLCGTAVEIGYVDDNPAALMTRTRAIKEVEASLGHLPLSYPEVQSRAQAALLALQIDDEEASKYIWELPRQKQLMVALAAAVASRPKVLILDEVCDMLDASGLALVHRTIQSITSRGGAVLSVDNAIDRQTQWSNRLAIMEAGRLSAISATEEAIANPVVLDRLWPLQAVSPTTDRPKINSRREPAMAVAELSFGYEDGPFIFEDAEFELGPGEVLGIAGQNGSGKTTLAKLLGGLTKPLSGTIALQGEDLEEEVRSARIATVVHATSAFFSESTIRKEIAFALGDSLDDEATIGRRIDEIADRFGIGGLLDKDPGILPSGIARLAQIAAVLAQNAPILVLDEVSAGMDPQERLRLVGVIRQASESGTSVVVLDHNLEFIQASANRVLLIERRKLRDLGHPSRAFASQHWTDLKAIDLLPPTQLSVHAGPLPKQPKA